MIASYNRKKWKDLSTCKKVTVVVLGVVQMLLLVAALIDLRKRSPQEITGGDKRIWSAVVFINYIGPIAYFLFGRKRTEVVSE
jgi:hypothetical protein